MLRNVVCQHHLEALPLGVEGREKCHLEIPTTILQSRGSRLSCYCCKPFPISTHVLGWTLQNIIFQKKERREEQSGTMER